MKASDDFFAKRTQSSLTARIPPASNSSRRTRRSTSEAEQTKTVMRFFQRSFEQALEFAGVEVSEENGDPGVRLRKAQEEKLHE
jgi:hypothetical protein